LSSIPSLVFTDEEIDGFIGRLLPNVVFVKPTESIFIVTDDPEDNKIIECAVVGESKYIISGDKHLLKIRQYKEIRIMKASDFLQEGWSKEEDC